MFTTVDVSTASEKSELPYYVCGEAKYLDIVSEMGGNILLSKRKFVKEGYVLVYEK